MESNASMLSPQRPKLLGLLIDAQNEQSCAFDEKYISFLKLAWQAQKDMEVSSLNVTANVLCKSRIDNNLDFKDDVPPIKGNNLFSSSFTSMFQLYRSYHTVGAETFGALAETKDSLSHDDVLKFLQDFKIVPKLASREEMNRVWSEMSQTYVAKKLKSVTRLTLEQFKEYIARLALFIFSAVGMRKAILACSGIVPTPEQMLQYLLHYARLDDDNFITEHIDILRSRQIAEANSSVNNSGTTGDQLLDINALSNEYEQVDVQPTRKSRKETAERLLKAKMDGEKDAVNSPSKRRLMRQARSPLTKFDRSSLIPTAILEFLDDPSNTYVWKATEEKKVADEKKCKPEDKAEPSECMEANRLPPVMAEVRNTYLDIYTDDLLKAFDHYCKPKPDRETMEGKNASHGAFCDLGRVDPGSVCVVRLQMHNRSPVDLSIDVNAVGFDDDTSTVVTNPKPLISGLSRHVTFTFKAPVNARSLVGCLELYVSNLGHRYECRVCVPVFLYVSPTLLMSSSKDICPISTDNLRATIEKYIGPSFFTSSATTKIDDDATSVPQNLQSVAASVRTVRSSDNDFGSISSINKGISFAAPREAWYGQARVGGGGLKMDNFSSGSIGHTKMTVRDRAMTAAAMSTNSTLGGRIRGLDSPDKYFDDSVSCDVSSLGESTSLSRY